MPRPDQKWGREGLCEVMWGESPTWGSVLGVICVLCHDTGTSARLTTTVNMEHVCEPALGLALSIRCLI